MAFTTIVTGTTISSSWANADVRDQVIVPFASTAARSSAITSPVIGQCSTLTTNTTTEGLYQYNTAGAWRGPWNLPWGVNGGGVASNGSSTQTIGTSYVDVTDLTLTWSQVARRKVRLGLMVAVDNQFAGGEDITFRVTDGTPTTILQLGAQKLELSGFCVYTASYLISTSATASTTWKVRAISTNGGARVVFNQANAQFSIIDEGPAGAPA
jgi:hypothetical protein